MPRSLDNESRRLASGGLMQRATLPVEPFPRVPEAIKTKSPDIQRAWGALEGEWDRWRKNLINSMLSSVPDIAGTVKRIDDAIAELRVLIATNNGNALQAIANIQTTITNLQTTVNQIVINDPTDLTALQQALDNLTIIVNGMTQYVFTQLSPATPWTIVHGRPIRPGGVRIMTTPDYREIIGLIEDDSIIGTTIITFGYNVAGIAVLNFS